MGRGGMLLPLLRSLYTQALPNLWDGYLPKETMKVGVLVIPVLVGEGLGEEAEESGVQGHSRVHIKFEVSWDTGDLTSKHQLSR